MKLVRVWFEKPQHAKRVLEHLQDLFPMVSWRSGPGAMRHLEYFTEDKCKVLDLEIYDMHDIRLGTWSGSRPHRLISEWKEKEKPDKADVTLNTHMGINKVITKLMHYLP